MNTNVVGNEETLKNLLKNWSWYRYEEISAIAKNIYAFLASFS